MKHILPLTYEPKIPDVCSGECTQTIRPISYTKPKNVGDQVMFHGWDEKPYRSKWNFRTPYWKIIESFDIHFVETSNGVVIRKADKNLNFHTLSKTEMNKLAVLDGFKNIEKMFAEFHRMYGDDVWEKLFTVIRWEFGVKKGG
ncbi:MAG TPA: hypothetical protein VMX17_03175 [Candidatus Glassbacteria bacterium]|nr:hypothetical protein [Candidatus Glassbacteria bacterium]